MCDMTHSYMCHDSQITDTMMTIVREEGFLALFLGAGHRMVWMALRGAVFFRCAVIHSYVKHDSFFCVWVRGIAWF